MIFILLVFLLAFGVALIGLAAALVVFWVLTHGVLRLFGYELTAAGVAKVSVVLTVVAAVSFLMSEGMLDKWTATGVAIGAYLGWLWIQVDQEG